MAYLSILERTEFWSRINIPQNKNDCWIWLSARGESVNRCYFKHNDKRISPAKIVYAIDTNIDYDSVIDKIYHRCGREECCNPSHLYRFDSFDRKVSLFWKKVEITGFINECWNWTGYTFNNSPYGQVTFDKVCRGGAHRVAYAISHDMTHPDDIPDGMFVLHNCDNPICCNPSHLRLGSAKDNMQDKVLRGRSNTARGEDAGNVKLTEDQVREIKYLHFTNKILYNNRILAKMYGVLDGNISRIVNGKRWSHVK